MSNDTVAARDLEARAHLLGRGWGFYLLATVALVPVVVPSGPAQSSIGDVINLLAILAFLVVAAVYRLPIRLPFVIPVLVATVGSVLALASAISASSGALTLVQDVYLYLWFVMLVALLRDRQDVGRLIRAWVWVATLLSTGVLVHVALSGHLSPRDLFMSQDYRTYASFYNPNMYADYLAFSLFLLLGLAGRMRRLLFWPMLAVLVVALFSAKSNGTLVGVAVGLLFWVVAQAWARGTPGPRLVGSLALAAGLLFALVWMQAGFGLGDTLLRDLGRKTFFGRVHKSTESRGRIWQRLQANLRQHPLGIGPGQSEWQPVSIGERESPNWLAKSPHDDFIAYAVERGPLGILGLLLFTTQMLLLAWRGRRRIVERLGPGSERLWAALVGALVASTVHSLVIQKLHFRHFWLFLAIVVALALEEREPGRQALPSPLLEPQLPGTDREPAAAHG